MTLDNLIGRSLERIPLDAARVLRLLEAASASIHDASLPNPAPRALPICRPSRSAGTTA